VSLRAKVAGHAELGRSIFLLCSTFLFVLCTSCGTEEKQTEIPPNILPKEKMVQVITDVHIAEAEANLRTLPDSTSKETISFQKIFEKNSISKQQYEESLTFYVDHPKLLNEIYEEVLNELSKMQGAAAK
jgi:Na+/phosphate symporter